MINQVNKYVLIFISCLILSACNKSVVYSKYITFKDNEWFAKDKAIFDVEISDNSNLNDISLMIRHADSYPFSNIFLFVTTKYPDGKTLTDTMEVVLANSKGEWQGNGAGDIFDLTVPIKKNVKFPQTGKYQFIFEQGMRQDPLQMMMDFGFEIKKSAN
ncbi:MAG: gliding motility lipoprotein GldH [Bacteroidetes bacterium]|nr:gliding motility lipoprotein GldH [Bacteroidota bacterium]